MDSQLVGAPQFTALQKQLVDAEAAGPARTRAPTALVVHGLHQRGHDPPHYLVLESKELVVRAVEVIGPDYRPILDLD